MDAEIEKALAIAGTPRASRQPVESLEDWTAGSPLVHVDSTEGADS